MKTWAAHLWCRAGRITRHDAGTCTGGGGACSAAAGVRRAVRFHSVKFYYTGTRPRVLEEAGC